MRIAIFTDTFLPQVNGVVRSIATTANALIERGHDVGVFTVNIDKLANSIKIKSDELDARVQVFPFCSVTPPTFKHVQMRIPTLVSPLRRTYRFKPDIIHTHTTFNMGWEAIGVARVVNRPLIGTHHGFLAEYLSNVKLDFRVTKDFMRRYLAFFYNRCDAVITPSHALGKELLEYRLKRGLHVISNPLNLSYFSTKESKAALREKYGLTKPTVVHFGRLIDQKSVDVVLSAFAHLLRLGVDADLLIIGDGRERDLLERLTRELRVAERVTFAGMLVGVELVERVAASDVFVSASTTETQGLVFLEAMALGLPVIGVRAGGVPEYVMDQQNGLIVEPHSPIALARAMRTLIQAETLRKSYGDHGQAGVKKYDSSVVVREFERLYQETIENRAR